MSMFQRALAASVCILCWTSLFSQELRNPSFEDTPQDATMPHGWHQCEDGTTPDILPGPWGVYTRAAHHRTFVGLITRPDGSREAIGQRMIPGLNHRDCYRMSFQLGHSPTYADYSQVIRIMVFLGEHKCDRGQLIYEGIAPDDHIWRNIELEFTAEGPWKYLRFEAVHPEGRRSSRGNLLLDDVRPPKRCART